MVIFHILKHSMRAAGNVCAVVDLACAQAKMGHTVYVCSSVGSFEELLTEHGVQSVTLNQIGNIRVVVPALLKLYRILRTIRPDIVHAHMMISAVLAAMLRPLLNFGLVTSVHNEFQRSAIVMGVGQRVIGVSEAVSQSMIRRGIPRSRMRTVLNGTINSVRRPNPMPAKLNLKQPAIATIGGMHPRKGHPDLIEAYAKVAAILPDAHLYLVGSGPKQGEYEALAKRICKGGVTFLGHMDDPRPVLLGADVFVLASHTEPAGLVLCEAREAGCAVVASDVGGIPEMLANGEAGILVPARSPDLLAGAILKLLQNPPFLEEMRAKARTRLEYFTMERVAAETERVYLELLSAKPTPAAGV
jgi:glycosyltransferase involved in cell wall biosynthesis